VILVVTETACPPSWPIVPAIELLALSYGSGDADDIMEWRREKAHHVFDVARFHRLVVLKCVGCLVRCCSIALNTSLKRTGSGGPPPHGCY